MESQPEQPLVTCLAAVVEAAVSKPSTTRTKLHWQAIHSEGRAADEAGSQTAEGHNGPTVTNPTVSEIEHSSCASQDNDDGGIEKTSAPRKSRLSASQLPSAAFTVDGQDSAEASEDYTLLHRSVAAGDENRRLVSHACLS